MGSFILVVLLGISENSVFCKLSPLGFSCKIDKAHVFFLLYFLIPLWFYTSPTFRVIMPLSSMSYCDLSSSGVFSGSEFVPLPFSALKLIPFLRLFEIIGFLRMVNEVTESIDNQLFLS